MFHKNHPLSIHDSVGAVYWFSTPWSAYCSLTLWKNVIGLVIRENACWMQTKVYRRLLLGILLNMKSMRETWDVFIKSVIFCKLTKFCNFDLTSCLDSKSSPVTLVLVLLFGWSCFFVPFITPFFSAGFLRNEKVCC